MDDETLSQIKDNIVKMKAYMDEITPKNSTLANNAAWKWIHKSMGTTLELFEPAITEPEKADYDFPKEAAPAPEPEKEPLPDPEPEPKPEPESEVVEDVAEAAAAEEETPIEDIKDGEVKDVKLEDE